MVSRLRNRHELRKQAEHAATIPVAPAVAPKKKAKATKTTKTTALARPRKPRAKPAPPRMCARWCVFNNSVKPVAVFDYSQRVAAEAKLADLRATHKGLYYLQIVKEPMVTLAPAALTLGEALV